MNHHLIDKALDDLSVGVGIFHVPDFDDIYNIEYVFINKVLLYEMRKTREEVFGKKIIEVAPEAYEHEGGKMVIETYRRIAQEGGKVNLGLVEYSNHMVAGTYECTVHHLEDHYVYVQLRNVTELEKALEEAKELKQFNYITSHDLQEPLNSIISYANLLELEKNILGEIGQKSIEVIKSSAYRMKEFITDLLIYSSIGKNKEKTDIQITELIEDLKVDLFGLIEKKRATVNYIGKPLKFRGIQHLISNVFQNLITNAIKYTEESTPPVIVIGSEEYNDHYKFWVKDNGIGIPEDQFEKIFEVFQRLHSRNKYSGTGIGLAQVKKAVDLHHGETWVTSTEGKGSTFYFTVLK